MLFNWVLEMNLSVDQQCFGEEILPRMKFVITEAVKIMTRISTMYIWKDKSISRQDV